MSVDSDQETQIDGDPPLSPAEVLRLCHVMQGLQIYVESIYRGLQAEHLDWQREHDMRLAVFSAINEYLGSTRLTCINYGSNVIPWLTAPNPAGVKVAFGNPRRNKLLLDYAKYI